MSAALYIVPEKKIPGFSHFVNGKALSKADNELEALAKAANVRSLMSFYSIDPDEAAAFCDEEGIEHETLPPEEWFSPEEGLVTIRALLAVDDLHPQVRADLKEFEVVLEKLRENSVRWHLAVDF